MKFEGKNAVSEALNSGTSLNKILISTSVNKFSIENILTMAKNNNVKVQFVPADIIKKESKTASPQGIIGFGEEFKYSDLSEIIPTLKPLFLLILDGIEDPQNFGSIIRSAECFGVDAIIISKNRACPVTETVIKTSAGAISHVKIIKVTNINQTIETLKKNNIWVYAFELGGEKLGTYNFSKNVAVVIGGEGKGVSMLTKKLCDGIITLDLYGKVNSLNASVAAGIALYEISKTAKS